MSARTRKPRTEIIPKSDIDLEKVRQVFQWIIEGATETAVREAIAKTWPDTESTPLIAAAVDEFRKAGEFDGGIVRGWCFEAYRDLYRRMVQVGDFGGAMRAVKLISDLAGVA